MSTGSFRCWMGSDDRLLVGVSHCDHTRSMDVMKIRSEGRSLKMRTWRPFVIQRDNGGLTTSPARCLTIVVRGADDRNGRDFLLKLINVGLNDSSVHILLRQFQFVLGSSSHGWFDFSTCLSKSVFHVLITCGKCAIQSRFGGRGASSGLSRRCRHDRNNRCHKLRFGNRENRSRWKWTKERSTFQSTRSFVSYRY